MAGIEEQQRLVSVLSVGNGSAGAQSIVFSNNQIQSLIANPTTTRSVQLPDANGTLALLTDIGVRGIAGGTQTATSGSVVFSNSNNVTFGMTNSSIVTASASFPVQTVQPGIQFVSGGTTRVTTGEIVFSNSNGVSFGINGQTLTASVSPGGGGGVGIAAGTQTATSATVVFSNSNNVTFGMSGSTLVTASASFAQSTAPSAIGAGTQTATSGSVVFSNSNGITFGMSGNTQVTASIDAIRAISAGTATAGGSQVVFSNSNRVSFGVNGLTITASAADPAVSALEIQPQMSASSVAIGSFTVFRTNIVQAISATQLDIVLGVSNSLLAAASVSIAVGVYTMSGSTASLASSVSRVFQYNSTLAGSSYSQISGTRYRSMTANMGTWAVTPGDYLFGIAYSVSTALTSGSYSFLGAPYPAIGPKEYAGGNYSNYFGVVGVYTAATSSPPNSIQLSQINRTFTGGVMIPWMKMVGTF